MQQKLQILAPLFDSIFVHYYSKGWTASAKKDVAAGTKIEVRAASGFPTPEEAVDDLYAKVQSLRSDLKVLP